MPVAHSACVEVVDALRALGGTARWKQLRGHVGWRALKEARNSDEVVCVQGSWRLTTTDRPVALAHELRGVRSHRAAALHHGFALPPSDDKRYQLTLRSNAHHKKLPDDVHVRYRRLPAHDVDGDVTTPLRTVIDCLRDESLAVALSVGDSALRSGTVVWAVLAAAVAALTGPGSRLAKARLTMLDARAANAFESSMRAILIEAGIEGFEPQVSIRHRRQWIGRVDLAHRLLRIVIECDGFETHGGRQAFVKDLVRFTCLVSAGWRPLRFTWEQVMFEPEWVLERVRDTIGDARRALQEEQLHETGASAAA